MGLTHARLCKGHIKKKTKQKLTFGEFVRCVIDNANRTTGHYGNALDVHWRPQTLLCNFCKSDYNIIGQMEHMNEDVIEALIKLNMTNKAPVQENVSKYNGSVADWYKQISPELTKDIQLLYKNDFELLGYDNIPPT